MKKYEDVFTHCASCKNSEILNIQMKIRPNIFKFRDKGDFVYRRIAKCKLSHCHYSKIKMR